MDHTDAINQISNQNGSAPVSPSMSQSHHQGAQSRQPVSYPSPTGSYPSPGQYQYPAPNNQVSEPYRASPTGSNGSMSLPSMRLDPMQQPQHMGSSIPSTVPGMAPYYHSGQTLPNPHQHYGNVTSDPTGQMRYALPVPDNRVMSGGRHKKEIKRRTKTGCLTCRKRRIKCDEAHPACRNCQKSKRECLGYDPIFKQQPGVTAIQPAPSSAPSQTPISAPSNPYGVQPSMLQGYGAQVPNLGYAASPSAGISSPTSTAQPFDYGSAIDPALEAAVAPAPSANMFTQPAKGYKVDDLLLKIPAGTQQISPEAQSEIDHLFRSIYAVGLENFLESKWFSNGKGLEKLHTDQTALNEFQVLIDAFSKTTHQDTAGMAYTSKIEGRVIWSLASMVKSAADPTNAVKSEVESLPASDDPVEAAHRLAVYENLVCGIVAESNPLKKPVPNSGEHHKLREHEFWYWMGQFVAQDHTISNHEIDETLSTLRNLLDGRENRDVLYSIAVIRAIGNRVEEYTLKDQPLLLDEQDLRAKLMVARRFINDEASGAGTTNVIRHLCSLVVSTWARPVDHNTSPEVLAGSSAGAMDPQFRPGATSSGM